MNLYPPEWHDPEWQAQNSAAAIHTVTEVTQQGDIMMNTYQLLSLVTTGFLWAAWVWLMGVWLVTHAKAFLNDAKYTPLYDWMVDHTDRYSVSTKISVVLFLVLGIPAGFIAGYFWPVLWPTGLCVGVLYSARSFIRFSKTYQAHKHDQKTGAVVSG